MRELLQKLRDPKIGGSTAGVIIILALIILYVNTRPPKPFRDISQLGYWDLNTQSEFSIPFGVNNEVAPMPAPSGPLKEDSGPLKAGGPAGVRLMMFACGGCENEQFMGYLETFTVEVRDLITVGNMDPEDINRGQHVRTKDGPWHNIRTQEAQDIVSAAAKRCKSQGKRLYECEPASRQ